MKFLPTLLSTSLLFVIGGCTSPTANNPEFDPNSLASSGSGEFSSASSAEGFSLPEVGVYSDLKLADFIRVTHPSRFYQSQEPSFTERIAVDMRNTKLDDFCETTPGFLVIDCKIIHETVPHAEFYAAEYNPYNDEYDSIGKYALFKTQSMLHPALFVRLDLSGPEEGKDLSSDDVIKQYLSRESQNPSNPERTNYFTDFVRSIHVEPPKEAEPEWRTYEDKEKGFKIDYPNGLFPSSYGGNNVFAVGSDGQFSISFFDSKDALENWIDSYWDHREHKTVKRKEAQVGIYDAEKITVNVRENGGLDTSEMYVVPAKDGYFVLWYDEEYFEGFKDMASTFRLLE